MDSYPCFNFFEQPRSLNAALKAAIEALKAATCQLNFLLQSIRSLADSNSTN
jgi:hypothetical protein